MHVMQAKALGPILRRRRVKNGQTSMDGELIWEPARTSNGEQMYNELPFMLDDLHDSWVQLSNTLSVSELTNLAAFIARLISAGVDNRLSICVLVLFRDVLESRELPPNPNHGAPRDAADLFPVMRAFIVYCRRHLLRLAINSFNDFPARLEASTWPGELARAEGLEQAGFSPARWKFWLKRLDSLPGAAAHSAEADKEGWKDSLAYLMHDLLVDWPKPFGSTEFEGITHTI